VSDKLKAVALGVTDAMTSESFWASENALARAQVLQHPALMASQIELLVQRLDLLEGKLEWLLRKNRLLRQS
jgi:hypothetical protein